MVSFVYFDIDRVLTFGFDWSLIERDIGIPDGMRGAFKRFWDEHEYELNMGRDIDTLIPDIENMFGAKFPEGYSFVEDGFVNRFTPNKTMWPVVGMLSKKVPVGLLTNMYPHMLDAMIKRGILPDVTWNAVVDSSVEKVQKPDYRIFESAEKRSGVLGSEILFVDNTVDNVNAAEEFGWNTFLYDPHHPKESSEKLEKFLLEDSGVFS